MSIPDIQCSEDGCERRTCMPEGYEPLCARHYLLSVKRAQSEAAARFQAHIAELVAARTCQCGHLDGQHFDEVRACSACECEHFLLPGQRLRDVLIPNSD